MAASAPAAASAGPDRDLGRQTNDKGECLKEMRRKFGQATLSLGDVTIVPFEKEDAKSPVKGGEFEKTSDSEKSASERSDSDSDAESVISEEDEEDEDEDEEEDNGNLPLSLHRLHSTASCKQPQGRGPVQIKSCGTAQQLADRAATDLKVRGQLSGSIPVDCVVKNQELQIASEDEFSCKVKLFCCELAVTEVGLASLAVSVIAIIPSGPQGACWDSPAERAKRTENGAEGWVFTCPSSEAASVLQRLSCCGGIRSGLNSYYHLFHQGKKGLGAFGFVVCAAELKSDRIVAVKVMKPKTEAKTIFKEVEMLIAAQGHPNIVRFFGIWADSAEESEQAKGFKRWSMLMDHYRGDLYDCVVEGRRFREQDTVPILFSMFSGIVYLHKKQIFHRDIKPENMLMDTLTRIVLTDFGISCHTSNVEELKRSVGTVGYASPEMLAGEATGYEGDEFGAGVVLYFMLSKSTPFLAPTPALTVKKTMEGKVNLNYGCFDHISQQCRNLIFGLVCKDIKKRLKGEDILKTDYMMVYRGSATEPVLESSKFLSSRKKQDVQQPAASNMAAPPTQGNLPALRRAGGNPKNAGVIMEL
eukprot:gb/GFBE01026587.1/.p1 GENE.gb/GFBE01026587.1/~~gb/GFBE01026587.1/.p1  ORF type:complete len:587 (+),score=140.32 gb/GFBE01026587.1/:1-1761(+)